MATKQQISEISAALIGFQEKFSSLSNDDAQYIIQNAGDAIDLFIYAIINRAKEAVQTVVNILSAIVCTFTVAPTTKKFVVKDKFKVDTSREAKIKISYLGDNFKKWFLGKIEGPFPGSTVYGRSLKKDSVDGPIIQGLGGNEAAKTTLAEVWALMKAQLNGESGDLLTWSANIFYIEDVKGTLRDVYVCWDGDGWFVYARSVENPPEWNAGQRVFYRKSPGSQAS